MSRRRAATALIAVAAVLLSFVAFLLASRGDTAPWTSSAPREEESKANSDPRSVTSGSAPSPLIHDDSVESPAITASATGSERRVAGTGSLRIVVEWGKDGRRAPSAPLRLVPVGVADSRLNERECATDDAGECLVTGLRPGRYAPECAYGGRVVADVEAERETSAVLVIPQGADVFGVVVDELDRPVPGAAVWLTFGPFRLIGSVVATSDALGTFRLDSIECVEGRRIAAHGVGYAPSDQVLIAAPAGTRIDVRLRLTTVAGELRGIVRGRSGMAIANALVVVGNDAAREFTNADGVRAASAAPARLRSGTDGTFRAANAPLGTVPILVRAPGHAPWRREVIVVAGGATEVVADLEPGVTLFGSVRGEDLLPVGDCEIRIGGWDDPAGSLVRTTVDGTYRLDAVTLGEFEVSAHERRAGRASARLRGEAGALLRWDPILAAGVRMTVKVVDEFDAPLRGWYAHVGATIDGQWESRWGPTAADGRFVAENCADGAYMVDVTEPGARFPAFRIMGVRPSVDEMVLRMTRAMRATAVITGRIVDPDGNGIEGAEVGVRREGDPVVVTVRTTADDGRYRIERIPAGSYFVEARARGRPANRSGPHVVAADVTCDAGSLRLAAPGWLVIRLRRDAGLPVGRPEICCQNVAGGRFEWLDVDEHGVARSSPLVAGAYRLWIYGLDVVTRSQDLEIKAGERTTLDVGFASGVQLRLRFTDSPVSRDLRQLRFRAIDPAGAVVDEVVLDREPPKPFEWWCGLRLGPWVIEARTLDGALRASARVTVRGIEDAGRIVPIALN